MIKATTTGYLGGDAQIKTIGGARICSHKPSNERKRKGRIGAVAGCYSVD